MLLHIGCFKSEPFCYVRVYGCILHDTTLIKETKLSVIKCKYNIVFVAIIKITYCIIALELYLLFKVKTKDTWSSSVKEHNFHTSTYLALMHIYATL